MTSKPLALLAAALLIAAPISRADDDHGAPPAPPDLATEAAAFMAATDANKDGKLTLDEVRKKQREFDKAMEAAGEDEKKMEAVAARFEQAVDLVMFLGADTNDDLVATLEEIQKALTHAPRLSDKDYEVLADEELNESWPMLLGAYDENKDKALSKAELKDDPEFGAEAFAKIDADKDGQIARSELARFMKARIRSDLERELRGGDDHGGGDHGDGDHGGGDHGGGRHGGGRHGGGS